jgi:arylformamidase
VIYDLTQPVAAGMAVWPGDPPVELEPALSLAAGQGANVARLSLGTHTGTHVDAPAHLIEGGATADALSLEALLGPAVGVPPAPGETAGTAALAAAANGTQRLLLRAGSGLGAATLAAAEAAQLADWGVILVGVEGPSVDRADDETLGAHHALLSRGVIIVEGLALGGVPPGRYQLICLPLRLAGGDGAPARAVLIAPEP